MTIDEELEEFSMSSVLRCDCINSSSLRGDPALLLLVCQSCTQKRPSVCFFSCAYVKVRQVSLQLSVLDSGDTIVFLQAELRLFDDITLYLFAYFRQST